MVNENDLLHESRELVAGNNKLEMLLFNLGSKENFGINVFKIREVSQAGKITRTPNMPRGVSGIVSLRGHVMPVLNLAEFMGLTPGGVLQTMMVAEYSMHTLGFLVESVDRIIRVDWDKVRPADGMLSDNGALINAITELDDGTLVSMLDVEQILSNAFGDAVIGNVEPIESGHEFCVFFADDSMVARRKIAEVLDKMGVKHIHANSGREAWDRLKSAADAAENEGISLHDQIQVILTDAEMPEMDGYVLTKHIKSDARFKGIPVVMHSSLSSEANKAIGKAVGVDVYVSKFDSAALSSTLRPLLN